MMNSLIHVFLVCLKLETEGGQTELHFLILHRTNKLVDLNPCMFLARQKLTSFACIVAVAVYSVF